MPIHKMNKTVRLFLSEERIEHTNRYAPSKRAPKGDNIPEETMKALLPKASKPYWFEYTGSRHVRQ